MSDINFANFANYSVFSQGFHAHYTTLPQVSPPSRGAPNQEDQAELFIFRAFNNVTNATQRQMCKTAATRFFKTVAWRLQILTGEEVDLMYLVIPYKRKFICTYCNMEHAQSAAALGCVYGHLDYKPFFCGQQPGQMCRHAKTQGLLGCGKRFVAQKLLNGHCR
ncbi:hypothetical protein CPB86DRAFT_814075 [Serendipita vermifera]|nr:hypothetical protein CPB86DRAFT_814075 [Serendipita vermifera]